MKQLFFLVIMLGLFPAIYTARMMLFIITTAMAPSQCRTLLPGVKANISGQDRVSTTRELLLNTIPGHYH